MRWPLVPMLTVAALAHGGASAQEDTVGADRLADLGWEYSLEGRTLRIRGCGQFRPGERHQCAEATLDQRETVEQVGRILRLPKDKVGLVIEPAGGGFRIVGLWVVLLKAPGVAERSATGNEAQIGGESLTEVSWTYRLRSTRVTLRVCGKLAHPEHSGCAERSESHSEAKRRLLEILLLEPVEKLIFTVGWDSAGKRFTDVRRISLVSR